MTKPQKSKKEPLPRYRRPGSTQCGGIAPEEMALREGVRNVRSSKVEYEGSLRNLGNLRAVILASLKLPNLIKIPNFPPAQPKNHF